MPRLRSPNFTLRVYRIREDGSKGRVVDIMSDKLPIADGVMTVCNLAEEFPGITFRAEVTNSSGKDLPYASKYAVFNISESRGDGKPVMVLNDYAAWDRKQKEAKKAARAAKKAGDFNVFDRPTHKGTCGGQGTFEKEINRNKYYCCARCSNVFIA